MQHHTGFPTKWHLMKDCRKEYYPDLPCWHIPIISMEILCSFLRAHFKGVTTDGVMKCYLKEVDNDTMLLFNSIHFRLETLFREHQGLMPMAKNCTLTNSAPIFAMTTMIIFMGVYPKTHTLLLAAVEYWFFFCCFLPFKTIRPLWILCKRSARVGYLFRRENLGREHGLFLAAILQDFLFSFLFTVLVWDPCIPHYPVPILG